MLAWVEYPLLNRHVDRLPADLINGVLGGDREKIKAEAARGIRQLNLRVATRIRGTVPGDADPGPADAARVDVVGFRGNVAGPLEGPMRRSRIHQNGAKAAGRLRRRWTIPGCTARRSGWAGRR